MGLTRPANFDCSSGLQALAATYAWNVSVGAPARLTFGKGDAHFDERADGTDDGRTTQPLAEIFSSFNFQEA